VVIAADVVQSILVSAVEEAEAKLGATAYSSSVAEAQDFAAAIYGADTGLIAQSRRASGTFTGTLGRGLRTVLRQIPPATLRPGDTLITNDPWIGGGHVPDVRTIRPVFYQGEIAGYVGNVAHLSDLGGKPSADSADNYEEGLHIPPMHLQRAGRLNETLMSVLAANSRLPAHVSGDVQAQAAANALMERRFREVLDRYGLVGFLAQIASLHARAEAVVRDRIARLPDGEYVGAADSDGVGERLGVTARLAVSGDTLSVDFDGSSAQSRWGLNVPLNLSIAETLYSLRVVLFPDLPLIEGTIAPFQVSAPVGCVLNPIPPAPTMVRTVVVHNVCAAVWSALAPLVPEFIPAHRLCAHFGGIWTFRFRGVLRKPPSAYRRGGPPHVSGTYTETYFSNGGMGAFGAADGPSTVSMPVNCTNVPIEVMESRAPVLFEEKRQTSDSGGAGTYRGGLGQQVRVRLISDDPVDFIVGTVDRIDHAPFGLAGGCPGQAGRLTIDGQAVDRRRVHRLRPNQTVTARLPGGGGYGQPGDRAPAAIERDLRLGLVTATGVERCYRPAPLMAREGKEAPTS
jgi:N-methylhydantoinase B